MTLTEFLTARIDEDERLAQQLLDDLTAQVADGGYTSDERGPFTPSRMLSSQLWAFYAGQARWRNFARGQGIATLADPARVLAECEAKRRIVAEYRIAESLIDTLTQADQSDAAHWEERSDALREAIGFLAVVYADHPDHDEAWAL